MTDHRFPSSRAPHLIGLAASALMVLGACSGTQEGGNGAGTNCDRIRGEMQASELAGAAVCHRAAGTDTAAAECRNGIDYVPLMDAETAGDLAACALQLGVREDGVWLADFMATAAARPEILVALANAFTTGFDTQAHGITWTSSLDVPTQEALGAVLGDVDPAARATIASLVLAYGVAPLSSYAAAYVGDIDPQDPGIRAFAEQLDQSDEPLDEFEREILIVTGTWSAQDAIDCFNGDKPGCEGWEGKSPLSLLSEEGDQLVGEASTPNAALRLLRTPGIDVESARGLAAFIGGAEYENRSSVLAAMMLDMTDIQFPRNIRAAIASAATPAMCEYDTLGDYVLRAATSDPDRFNDASAPWPTFVSLCAERHWSADDLISALSAGSWLGVPADTYAGFGERLTELASDLSCDEYRAMGATAYERNPWVLMRGLAHPIAATLGGEACAPVLQPQVDAVATSTSEHPEARLAAVEWQVRNGDRSGCSQVDRILDWRHVEYDVGPGDWARARGAAVDALCD